MTALPVPVAETFRSTEVGAGYPELGEANDEMLSASLQSAPGAQGQGAKPAKE